MSSPTVASQPVAHAQPMTYPTAAPPPGFSPPPPLTVAPRTTSWTAGGVLLALGAILLIVAGIIFISVTWGSMGLFGRAMVLLAVTAVVGGLAWWAGHRKLRGSAEALWAVFLGLLALDWGAAHVEGLFGLDRLWDSSATVIGSLIVAAVGVGVVTLGRRQLSITLVTPQLAIGSIAWVGASALGSALVWNVGWTVFWGGCGALVLSVLAVGLSALCGTRVALILAATHAALTTVWLVAVAMWVLHSGGVEVTLRDGAPMFTLSAAALLCGLLVRTIRVAAGAFALATLIYLVATVVHGFWYVRGGPEISGGLALAAFVAVLPALLTAAGAWRQGFRIAMSLATFVLATWSLVWLDSLAPYVNATTAARMSEGFWGRPATYVDQIGPAWLAAVMVGAVAVAVASSGRWPQIARTKAVAHTGPLAWTVALGAVVVTVASARVPFVVLGLALAALGALAAVLLRRAWPGWGFVAPLIAASALMVGVEGSTHQLVIWAVTALALVAIAASSVERQVPSGALAAGLATLAAIGVPALMVDRVARDDATTAIVLTAFAAGVLVVAMLLDEWPWHRIGVEISCGLGVLTAMSLVDLSTELGTFALLLAMAGLAMVVVGLLDDDRASFRLVGAALLTVAYLVRLSASQFGFVEAYTGPFALLALVTGIWAMRERPDLRSWAALSAGLALALLPSLPQTLADPSSIRGLCLGLVALLFVLGGVVKKWGAPVVFGAIVLLVVVIANIGPSLSATVPRWALIGAAGVLLLFLGTTWEKRVVEGRALVARIADLR